MTRKLQVALFSGGRGTASIADALLNHSQLALTIIVNAYDDGLSTGELRRFIPGMLGASDVRKNLVRLIQGTDPASIALAHILEYRFPLGMTLGDGWRALQGLKANFSTGFLGELDEDYDQLAIHQAKCFSKYLDAFLTYAMARHAKDGTCITFADCSLGNILLAGAFLANNRDFNLTITEFSRPMPLAGSILNITGGENLVLVGIKEDGTLLLDEAQIVAKQNSNRVLDIFLLENYLREAEVGEVTGKDTAFIQRFLEAKSSYPSINPKAALALASADVIIYGPGTQHSSLFPSYLTAQVAECIAGNKAAEKIFISNILKDNEIQNETASSLCDKTLTYLNRKGQSAYGWDELISNFFFQIEGATQEADYVRFDAKNFRFPLDKVVLTDWEMKDGKHLGGRVLDELISLVNARLETRIMPYHYQASIIVPALNEERTVKRVLRELVLLDLQKLGIGKEIIFVDGGSTDQTLAQAKEVSGVQVLALGKNEPKGRGAAFKKGIEHARGNLIIFFPSDDEYNAEDLRSVVQMMVKGEFQVIFGSRAIKCVDLSSRIRDIYRHNRMGYLVSKYGGILLSVVNLLLFNRYVSDALTGIKAFDARLLRSLELVSNSLDFELEILAKLGRKGTFILEVPVDYRPRTKKQGKKTTFAHGLQALWRLVSVRFYWPKNQTLARAQTAVVRNTP